MGKNNSNKKKQRPNYFQNNMNMFGDDFIARKTPIDIQKDAKRIFSDLSYGNIDIQRDAIFFTNVNFLINLRTVALDNYKYHAFTSNGMKQIINQSTTNQVEEHFIKVLEIHDRCAAAYGIVLHYLDNILQNKGATINLTEMVRELQAYRGAFSEIMFIRSDNQRRNEKETY